MKIYREVNKEDVLDIRNATGVGMMDCKRAILYAIDKNEGRAMAIAWLRASGLAVSTPNLTFDERVLRFYREEDNVEEVL